MKKRRNLAGRGLSRKSRVQPLQTLERMEDRLLMATFVVTDLSDSVTDTGSLRYAITQSNATTTSLPNQITFSGLSGIGPFTLATLAPLPAITQPVSLDATTAPGFNTATNQPVFEINGGQQGNTGSGLQATVQGVSIRGFDIDGISGFGISLSGNGGDVVAGNYIGPDLTGTRSGNNVGIGIEVDSGNNTIGGITAADQNVISSWSEAINLAAAGGSNLVEGNYIGTNAAGTAALGGQGATPSIAVNVNGSAFNTIGGAAGAGNLISGYGYGVEIQNNASFNGVFGNLIGTDYTGNVKIGNTFDGVLVSSSAFVSVGGTTNFGNTLLPGNVIAGSQQYGIEVTGGGFSDTSIQSNNIGVGLDGKTSIGNGSNGIFVQGTSNVTIGGALPGVGVARNFAGEKTLGNTIDNNGFLTPNQGAGVLVTGNVVNVGILSNAIFNNIGGIFLGQGSNQGVKAPVLISAASGGGQTQVRGTLNEQGKANSTFRVQIFSGPAFRTPGREDGQTFIGEADVTTDDTGAANFTISIGTLTGIGNYITATATQNALNAPQTSVFSNQQIVTLATVTDLSVAVAPQAGNPYVGQNYSYVVVVANAGPNAATGVTLSDTIPTNSTFVSSTGGTFNVVNGVLTDDIGALAGAPSLSVVSTPPQGAPVVGQAYTYVLTVTNNDTVDATNVVLTDTIPSNSTFQSASVGNYTGFNRQVTSDLGYLAAGASTTVSITVLPTNSSTLTDTPAVVGSGAVTVTIVVKPNSVTGAFTNVATVSSSNVQDIDPNLNNNTVTTTSATGVLPDAVLTLSLVPALNPTPVGQPVTFVLTLTNQGPSTVNNGVITINLPTDFTNIVVTPDQGTYSTNGSTITVNTSIVPSGGSTNVTFSATPGDVGNFSVNANVTSSLFNPSPSGASVSVPITVANSSDLALAISAAPDPVLLGQALIYTLVVTNNGPSTSPTSVVTDTLPAGLTFNAAGSSDSNGGTITYANGVITDTLTSLDSGATDIILISVTPTSSGPITNTATVNDASVIDPTPSNNTASVTSVVNPADLMVTILNPTDPLFIGTQAVYQIQVTNNGPATATNVLLSDTFGPGAQIVGQSAGTAANSASGSTLNANLGSLPSGATVTVLITIDPTASGNLTDSASVSSDEFDTNSNNNSNVSSNIVSPVALGVAVTGTPASVLVGGQLTYVYTVTNGGPAGADNVVLSVSLPSNVTFASQTSTKGSLVLNGGVYVANLGSIASGASVTFTVVATATSTGTATSTASVTTTNLDTTPTSETASASVTVINVPGLVSLVSNPTIVTESSGSVTISLTRTAGSLGPITVDYATSDYTAKAGVNYVASSGTVSFADGQTTATITIPIIDAHLFGGSDGFFVTLSNPGGGATLGSSSVAAVLIVNTDRDMTPPVIVGFTYIPNPNPNYLNGFVITFDKAMDPTLASLVSNYTILLSNHDAGKGADTIVPLAAAFYNPANNTVTLVPTHILPQNAFYHVIVNGSVTNALTDTSGNLLVGDGGQFTNYDIFYGVGTKLNYRDGKGNAVNISISGGGKMEIVRAPNGDVATIKLFSIVPHKSKLVGSVKKLSKKASGFATIGSLTGLGRFGDVFSTLTTPNFYVLTPEVFISNPPTVAPVTVTLPPVTVTLKSIRGPLSK